MKKTQHNDAVDYDNIKISWGFPSRIQLTDGLFSSQFFFLSFSFFSMMIWSVNKKKIHDSITQGLSVGHPDAGSCRGCTVN